jgi:tetratricopeptide (TPR) repeat protein
LRESLEGLRRVKLHYDQLTVMDNLARMLVARDRPDQAESLWRERVDVQERTFGGDHSRTLWSMNQLAWFLKDRGPDKLDEAQVMATAAVDGCRSALGESHRQTILTTQTLGVILHMQGRRQDAVTLFEAGLAARETLGDDLFTRWSPFEYDWSLINQQRYERAETILQTAWEDLEALHGDDRPQTRAALAALIHLYDAWGKPENAAGYRKMLREAEGVDAPDSTP